VSVRYDATDGAPTLKYKKGTKRVVTERIASETLADTLPKGPLGERGACRALGDDQKRHRNSDAPLCSFYYYKRI